MTKPKNILEATDVELDIDLSSQSNEEKISIIIIHNDRPEYLDICLHTIAINSTNNNYEIIIVDNGSEQESQDYLDDLEQCGIKIIRNTENLYWTRAANQGAQAASKDSKYLVFVHHDINVLSHAWLDMMANISDAKKSGLVGFGGMRKYSISNQIIPFVEDYCMLIKRDCWKDCGPFKEDLPQDGATFIFNIIAHRKGYNPQAVNESDSRNYVHHFRSFAMDISEYERMNQKLKSTIGKVLASIDPS